MISKRLMKGGIERMLNPVRLIDWMYLYQSGEDKRPEFYLRTDNETFPKELRLKTTSIPDLNMRIRKENLDEVFERVIDHITPVFGRNIASYEELYFVSDTAGLCTVEIADGGGNKYTPVGVLVEIFLKPEEEKKDD